MSNISYIYNTGYTYPTHCKFSKNWEPFHLKWHNEWTTLLKNYIGKDNVNILEIGTFHGSCAVWLLDVVLTGKNSQLYTINPTSNEYIENNLKPYENAHFIEKASYDALINLSNDKQNYFDVIYIDGCHFSKYVLEDAVLSFKLLKEGGILIFDDYGWGIHTSDIKLKPKTAIDSFLNAYDGHYKILNFEWQVYIQKIKCEYNMEEVKDTETKL